MKYFWDRVVINNSGVITPTILVLTITMFLYLSSLSLQTRTLTEYAKYYKTSIYQEYNLMMFEWDIIQSRDPDDVCRLYRETKRGIGTKYSYIGKCFNPNSDKINFTYRGWAYGSCNIYEFIYDFKLNEFTNVRPIYKLD